MPTPTPVPENASRPIQWAVFEQKRKLLMSDYGSIEGSHVKAEAWINENQGIEIVEIQTFNSSLSGITVIW